MTPDKAETFALNALAWLAADEELLGGFMGLTGLAFDDVRNRAGDAEFLGAVLDYILSDDSLVLALADAVQVAPEQVAAARISLPGGAQFHWT